MTVGGDPQTHAVLNRLDSQLGEAGRREHRFAWLRDARSDDWLVVDAYYPSNRVVVVASDDPDLLELCEALVPANGMFLLTLESADLAAAGSSESLAGGLGDRLAAQGWVPRLTPERPERPREAWAARQTPSAPRSGEASTGVVLVIIVVAELVLGGGVVGIGDGAYVLGFGLLLDACARVLGAVAASQNHDPDAAWTSVLFGSPVLWARGELSGDAAGLAQVTAILAGFCVLVGLVLVLV